MERIIILTRTTKSVGNIRLRFRLYDGRGFELFHKSQISASLEDLKKFNIDGTLRPKVSVYNKELADSIDKEIKLIREAYGQMKKKGTAMTSPNLEEAIENLKKPEERTVVYVNKSLVKRFTEYVEAGYRDGIFGLSRYKHDKGTIGKLERYLATKRKRACTYDEFDDGMLMGFREFVQNEFEYVEKYPNIYKKLNKRDTPTERRSNNTVANEMQVLRAFFTELEDTEEINRSPFRKISRDRRVILTRKKYDDPIFLRKEEFETLRNFKPAKSLEETK